MSTPSFACGMGAGFRCLDPAFFDPEVVAEYPDCAGSWLVMGDGNCNPENNNAACGYDGGDCCFCSCSGAFCSRTDFDCLDPTANEEFYECQAPPPDALPCSEEVQQVWTVENSEQARALAAAVNCSGGLFEVEWRGKVVLDETIPVVGGTVLTVVGADNGAAIDGKAARRIFTVIDAVLHLNDVTVTSGASLAGGAIAASGSALTFNRTNFVGNSATAFGGAVFVSDGSNVSCTGEGTFANNRADMHGGAMWVAGGSMASCGSSWINNTAAFSGGALVVLDDSSASWGEDATFAWNTAYFAGAIMLHTRSSVSWSGATTFSSNSAAFAGGALDAISRSTFSWTGDTKFINNVAHGNEGRGGAMYVLDSSAVSWSGNTEFVANAATRGGAVFVSNASSISWTGTTEFTSNEAGEGGGGFGSMPLDPSANTAASLLVIDGSTTFSNNSCGASGGALALLGGLSVHIGAADVSFINNTAALSGGAVFISGTGAGPIFPGVSFVSNSAQVGGAVSSVASGNLVESVYNSPTTFDRCRFIDNEATATGGAIESAAGQDVFVGSVFEGNKAGTGGALRLAGTSSMENCSFVDNLSDDGRGTAVSNIGSILKMENISFSGNIFDCKPGMFLGYNAVSVAVCACCRLGAWRMRFGVAVHVWSPTRSAAGRNRRVAISVGRKARSFFSSCVFANLC